MPRVLIPAPAGAGGTPDPHAASHQDGGTDELDVTGLTGAGGGGGGGLDLTAKGQIHGHDGTNDVAIAASGTNGNILTEDSNLAAGHGFKPPPTGTVPTPAANEIFVANAAGTAGIWIESRGAYVEAYRGTEANLLADCQAAIDSLPTRGGTVDWASTTYDFGTDTVTDSEGRTTRLIVPPGVTLQGAGRGSAQSGGQTPPTLLTISGAAAGGSLVTMHDGESGNNNAEWQGYFMRDIHLEDGGTGNARLDRLLLMQQGNQSMLERCSFGDLKKAGSVAMEVIEAPGGQATQYGRIRDCNFDVDHGGILFSDHSPDWEILNCSIISRLDEFPSAGSFGIKGQSNAIRIIGCEIQFWDIGVYIDCTGGRGLHWTLDRCHFECHQSAGAGTYQAYVYVDKTATTGWSEAPSVDAFTLMTNCESGNLGALDWIFDIEDGASGIVDGSRIDAFRVRGSSWLTSTHAKLNPGARSAILVDGVST